MNNENISFYSVSISSKMEVKMQMLLQKMPFSQPALPTCLCLGGNSTNTNFLHIIDPPRREQLKQIKPFSLSTQNEHIVYITSSIRNWSSFTTWCTSGRHLRGLSKGEICQGPWKYCKHMEAHLLYDEAAWAEGSANVGSVCI